MSNELICWVQVFRVSLDSTHVRGLLKKQGLPSVAVDSLDFVPPDLMEAMPLGDLSEVRLYTDGSYELAQMSHGPNGFCLAKFKDGSQHLTELPKMGAGRVAADARR